MEGWFEKLAQEEPALYGELAPGVHIPIFTTLNHIIFLIT